jgi:hypothetical protein
MTIFIVLFRLSRWQMKGRWMVVAKRLGRLALPLESFLQRGMGRSWARRATAQVFFGAELRNKRSAGYLKMQLPSVLGNRA